MYSLDSNFMPNKLNQIKLKKSKGHIINMLDFFFKLSIFITTQTYTIILISQRIYLVVSLNLW